MNSSAVEIPLCGSLGQGMVAVVDDTDSDLASHTWWFARGYPYTMARRGDKGRTTIRMHQMVATRMWGEHSGTVDHIDRNPLNNRRNNLRIATQSQQNANMAGWGMSGYRGVSWDKDFRRWRADVWRDGKRRWSKYFSVLSDAVAARQIAARAIHGEFAIQEETR